MSDRCAFAYLRTSSRTNVEGDSSERQRVAIERWAQANGWEIAGEFYDAAVSGADPVDSRPGFKSMLGSLNGVRTILVETASRFARDLMVQEVGHEYLRGMGVQVIAVDHPDQFLDDGPTAVMVRQILGAVSQFEKASMVAKLKAARDRKSLELGRRCEAGGGHAGVNPKLPAFACHIRRVHPGMSLREVADRMAAQGFGRADGRPFCAGTIARWVRG